MDIYSSKCICNFIKYKPEQLHATINECGPQGADSPPLPLGAAKAGKNKLNK